MFHHTKDGKASFRSKVHLEPGARPAKPNGASPMKKPEHGEPQAPHDAHSHEEHVTKTHPGKTEPHPVTGVHAHAAHHTGGGKYTTHTHHDDGSVESRDNRSHEEMVADQHEAFPPDEMAENEGSDQADGFATDLAGGIGGEGQAV